MRSSADRAFDRALACGKLDKDKLDQAIDDVKRRRQGAGGYAAGQLPGSWLL